MLICGGGGGGGGECLFANFPLIPTVCVHSCRMEGLRGFYKGLAAYMIHVTPNICIVLLFYEKLPVALASFKSDERAETVATSSSDTRKAS